tara:strand:+ start:294 stop:422 length:129 start_codon:yes stop_codon:yes gene_type:complete
MVVAFIGLSWVGYALLGLFDGVYDYIAWKIWGVVKVHHNRDS